MLLRCATEGANVVVLGRERMFGAERISGARVATRGDGARMTLDFGDGARGACATRGAEKRGAEACGAET